MTLLGERLRQVRKHLGITQKQLAVETHLSQSTISRLENGEEVYSSVITTILHYYQQRISIDYLFSKDFDVKSENLNYYIRDNLRNLIVRHLSIMAEAIDVACDTSLNQINLLKMKIK